MALQTSGISLDDFGQGVAAGKLSLEFAGHLLDEPRGLLDTTRHELLSELGLSADWSDRLAVLIGQEKPAVQAWALTPPNLSALSRENGVSRWSGGSCTSAFPSPERELAIVGRYPHVETSSSMVSLPRGRALVPMSPSSAPRPSRAPCWAMGLPRKC
jgi:hypothetical protein